MQEEKAEGLYAPGHGLATKMVYGRQAVASECCCCSANRHAVHAVPPCCLFSAATQRSKTRGVINAVHGAVVGARIPETVRRQMDIYRGRVVEVVVVSGVLQARVAARVLKMIPALAARHGAVVGRETTKR